MLKSQVAISKCLSNPSLKGCAPPTYTHTHTHKHTHTHTHTHPSFKQTASSSDSIQITNHEAPGRSMLPSFLPTVLQGYNCPSLHASGCRTPSWPRRAARSVNNLRQLNNKKNEFGRFTERTQRGGMKFNGPHSTSRSHLQP